MTKYYSLAVCESEATVNIFGDITSWPWLESDVSSYSLSKEIEELDVDILNVCINSYGGEVAEGLAIYNSLKRHKAQVKTYCNGFACSIASIIFAAGDERIMYDSSLLFIHNAWSNATGDADSLKKAAADLEIVNDTAMKALENISNLEKKELKQMLDDETWLTPEQSLEMGFATKIEAFEETGKASANARALVIDTLTNPKQTPETIKVNLDYDKIAESLMKKIEEKQAAEEKNPQERKLDKFLNAIFMAEKE